MKRTLQTVLVIMLAVTCTIFMGSARPVHADTSAASSTSSTSASSSYKILFQNFDSDNGEAEESIGGRTFDVFNSCNDDDSYDYEDEDDDDSYDYEDEYDDDSYDYDDEYDDDSYDYDDEYDDDSYDYDDEDDDDSYDYDDEDDDSEESYELDWYDDTNTDGTVISEDCSSPVIVTDGNTVFFTEIRDDQECLVKYSCSSNKSEVIKTFTDEDYDAPVSFDSIHGNILFIDSISKPMSVYGLDLQTSEFFKITGGVIESFSGQYFLCAKCNVPCDDFFGSWYIYKMDGHKSVPVKKLTSCSNIARLQGGRIYYVSYSTRGKNQVMKIYSIKTDGTGKKRIKTLKAKSIYAIDINKKHCWYVNGNKTYRFDFSTRKVHKVSNTVMP
ncbi:MAG: DUF5050 domain-containing protein [Eubacterium sp.]|jgi:hypothetical protein|nr:DUF5050 domain-containing protein [Eubacterium sp.]MCI2197543.1 DUF5050 domain-containing protein [Eubacterium sp.]